MFFIRAGAVWLAAMTTVLAFWGWALSGCATKPATEAAPAEEVDPVTRAVALAEAIEADPEHAEETLAARGMTEADLDALLYAIAEDPVQAAAYAEARGEDTTDEPKAVSEEAVADAD